MIKEEILPPGKYIVGDFSKFFNEKDVKKFRNSFLKSKRGMSFDKKYNVLSFKPLSFNIKFEDYIDNCPGILAENGLVLIDATLVNQPKLFGCKRFSSKEEFKVKYVNDSLGVAIYFKRDEDCGPFMMLVQEPK